MYVEFRKTKVFSHISETLHSVMKYTCVIEVRTRRFRTTVVEP